MRPPGPTLHVSGGDIMLAGLWLKPAQVDALLKHHAAALADAHEDASVIHHRAWLSDLNRVILKRANHRRAPGGGQRRNSGRALPSPLRGGGRGWGCCADVTG